MELNVKERFVLLGMLPKEANFMTLKLMRTLKEALSFDEEEIKVLNFKNEEGRLFWEQNIPVMKSVTIGDFMLELLKKEFKKLDSDGKLTEDHFSLFEKVVGDKE
ncbi:MAG: hypothetical protein KKH61_20545 [Gammaproteobacteria bacterium]|nr:hypothetical protein [Gammaproteobacteria bacterium]